MDVAEIPRSSSSLRARVRAVRPRRPGRHQRRNAEPDTGAGDGPASRPAAGPRAATLRAGARAGRAHHRLRLRRHAARWAASRRPRSVFVSHAAWPRPCADATRSCAKCARAVWRLGPRTRRWRWPRACRATKVSGRPASPTTCAASRSRTRSRRPGPTTRRTRPSSSSQARSASPSPASPGSPASASLACASSGHDAAAVLAEVEPRLGPLRHAHFGSNHWAWLYDFRDSTGADRTSEVIEAVDTARLVDVDRAAVRREQAVPLHYLSLHYHRERELARQRGRAETRGAELARWADRCSRTLTYAGRPGRGRCLGPARAAADDLVRRRGSAGAGRPRRPGTG